MFSVSVIYTHLETNWAKYSESSLNPSIALTVLSLPSAVCRLLQHVFASHLTKQWREPRKIRGMWSLLHAFYKETYSVVLQRRAVLNDYIIIIKADTCVLQNLSRLCISWSLYYYMHVCNCMHFYIYNK